jgi:hypothetical protein
MTFALFAPFVVKANACLGDCSWKLLSLRTMNYGGQRTRMRTGLTPVAKPFFKYDRSLNTILFRAAWQALS